MLDELEKSPNSKGPMAEELCKYGIICRPSEEPKPVHISVCKHNSVNSWRSRLSSNLIANIQCNTKARDGAVSTHDRGYGNAAWPQYREHMLINQKPYGKSFMLDDPQRLSPHKDWMTAGILNIVTLMGNVRMLFAGRMVLFDSKSVSKISEGFTFEQGTRHKGRFGAVMFNPIAQQMKSVRSL